MPGSVNDLALFLSVPEAIRLSRAAKGSSAQFSQGPGGGSRAKAAQAGLPCPPSRSLGGGPPLRTCHCFMGYMRT